MLAIAVAAVLSSYVDYDRKEINLKLVYVATDPAAAWANVAYVYAKTAPDAGRPVADEPEKTEAGHYYSFLPLSLGEIRGFKTRFHLYTVGTEKQFTADRRRLMRGADGVVFIAERDPQKASANTAALAVAKADLAAAGTAWDSIPIVYQAVGEGDVAGVRKALSLPLETVVFEANPSAGSGVFDTLKAAAKGMLMALKKTQ